MTTKERTKFCADIQKRHGQKITFALVSLFAAIHLGCTVLSALSFTAAAVPGIGPFVSFAVLLLMLIGIYALHMGFCFILIKLIRNENAILGDMLSPFRNFKRTAQSSIVFVTITLVISFAASMLILSTGTIEQMLSNFENPETGMIFPPIFAVIVYAAVFITLLLNIPLIYLPFFDFDMKGKPHKEARNNAFALFKESLKQLFSGCISFSGRNMLILALLLVMSFLNIKLLSNIAAFFTSILFFLVYASVMLMTAAVYQDFTQPEPEFEVLAIDDDTTEPQDKV